MERGPGACPGDFALGDEDKYHAPHPATFPPRVPTLPAPRSHKTFSRGWMREPGRPPGSPLPSTPGPAGPHLRCLCATTPSPSAMERVGVRPLRVGARLLVSAPQTSRHQLSLIDRLEIDFDIHIFTHEHAASFERLVPVEAPVFAVNLCFCA